MKITGSGANYQKTFKEVNDSSLVNLLKEKPVSTVTNNSNEPKEQILVSQLLGREGKATKSFTLGFDDINFKPTVSVAASVKSSLAPLISVGLTIAQADEVSGFKSIKYIKFNPVFPDDWVQSISNGKGTPPESSTVYERIKTIEKAFDKYPSALVEANLKNVYLAQTLEFYGAPYGGTNSRTSLYLANKDEQSVHHEFSSILLRSYPQYFDNQAWLNINTEAYNDPTGGAGAIKAGKAGGNYDENLMKKGFLTQYSSTSKENDFNVIAEKLFTGDKELWTFAAKYPKIKDKVDSVINFYNKTDPTFTKDYFKNISN